MKLSEFMVLPQEEKRAAILKEGVPIAKRELQEHMIFLFQLHRFYVETHCSKQNKTVVEYSVFHNPEHLTPYLQAIEIDNLLDG